HLPTLFLAIPEYEAKPDYQANQSGDEGLDRRMQWHVWLTRGVARQSAVSSAGTSDELISVNLEPEQSLARVERDVATDEVERLGQNAQNDGQEQQMKAVELQRAFANPQVVLVDDSVGRRLEGEQKKRHPCDEWCDIRHVGHRLTL